MANAALPGRGMFCVGHLCRLAAVSGMWVNIGGQRMKLDAIVSNTYRRE